MRDRLSAETRITFGSLTYAFMRTSLYIVLTATLFASCSPRLYVDGHRVHLPNKVINSPSVAILGLQDSLPLPDSAIRVGRIFIQGSLWSTSSDNKLLDVAWSEAAKLGGNLVKVNSFLGVYESSCLVKNLTTTVYRLDSFDLARLREQIRVAGEMRRNRLKGVAVVHLKDDDEWGHREIRLSDSLAGTIEYRGFVGDGGTGRMDLRLHHAGMLTLGKDNLDIRPGNEYFIKLFLLTYKNRGHQYTCQGYVLTDKQNFDN